MEMTACAREWQKAQQSPCEVWDLLCLRWGWAKGRRDGGQGGLNSAGPRGQKWG